MPRLRAEERNRALGHLEAGVDARQVANIFNVHISTIYRLQHRMRVTGTTDDRPRPGRPRVTTPREDRHLVRTHLRDRLQTAANTARQVLGNPQQRISLNTVRRRLQEMGLACRRPHRGPVLTPRHRRDRLQWAQARINWRRQQWGRILFSDESRFCIDMADGRVRIWRRRRERYADSCVVERNPWGGPNVMIWGAIGINHAIGPVIFQNIGPGRGQGVNAQRYINQVLRPHIVPFFAQHPNWTFQQDNARPHTARDTQQFLQQNNVNVLPWPSLSPDLNPIEHFWDELGRRLGLLRPRPATLAQLQQAIVRVWAGVPRGRINHLVHSMGRRCQAVITANGGHTRY